MQPITRSPSPLPGHMSGYTSGHMAESEHVPLAEVKNHLSELVERVEREHGRVVITKHGRPAAVVLAMDDLESLEETLAILSDPTLMADLREAEADVARGRTERLTKPRLLEQIKKR
jgi:antitoxin YefM